jgi:cysteine desulfurase
MIYLDNNATTRIHPEVAEAMLACYRDGWGNPSSQHAQGRRARRALEEARETIGQLLGATVGRDRILFTSGGTEANHLIWLGTHRRHGRGVVSEIEHPSLLGAAELWRERGGDLWALSANAEGVCDPATPHDPRLAEVANEPLDIVSLMLANHETGVLQPVERLATCFPHAMVWHTDAVQAVGRVAFQFRDLNISAMTVAAHKFHGPLGIGALILREDVPLAPLFRGGFQQQGYRPGTESVPLAVGMAQALQRTLADQKSRIAAMRELRDRLAAELLAADPVAVVVGADSERLPQTLCISFPGLDRQALLLALDLEGIACSTGSACASGSSEPSPVLEAMGCSEEIVRGALRFSLSLETSEEEIEQAIPRITQVLGRFRGKLTVVRR